MFSKNLIRGNNKISELINVVFLYIIFSGYLSTYPGPNVFIQGSRENYTSPWYYDNGDKMTFFNWNFKDGQPENKPGQNWIIVHQHYNFTWNDRANVTVRSICELH